MSRFRPIARRACVIALLAAQARAIAVPPDAVELERQVEAVSRRIEAMGIGGDLLEDLYFAWSDRPYARATIAALSKTATVLRREARMRRAGNGAIGRGDIEATRVWIDEALDRILADEPFPGFRPNRVRVTAEKVRSGGSPPMFAFVDRSTATRRHAGFGDLDVLAALGQRVAVFDLSAMDEASASTLRERAAYLGMGVVTIGANRRPALDATSGSRGGAESLFVKSLTLAELLGGSVDHGGSAVAVIDADVDESWSERLARRALFRGATGRKRTMIVRWRSPPGEGSAMSAAMWLDALEGMSLAAIEGWRDLRDGSTGVSSSVFADPGRIESCARTALDILRCADRLRPLVDPPRIAVIVSSDAAHPDEGNRWADWTRPAFDALLESAVAYDLVPSSVDRPSIESRYATAIDLSSGTVSRFNEMLRDALAERAVPSGGAAGPLIREMDGSRPRDFYVRILRDDRGRTAIAAINLSREPRTLLLTGVKSPSRWRDLLSGTSRIDGDGRFSLSPWRVALPASE